MQGTGYAKFFKSVFKSTVVKRAVRLPEVPGTMRTFIVEQLQKHVSRDEHVPQYVINSIESGGIFMKTASNSCF